jgi:hypothetical protein
MCTGVVSGFAIFRFSTSPSKLGLFEITITNTREIHIIGIMSFLENVG